MLNLNFTKKYLIDNEWLQKNFSNWIRFNEIIVVLKSLDKSSNLNEEFLNEV